MTTPRPSEPEVRPDQLKSAPFYWPNLMAALVSAIAVAVGSIGPWIAFMGMTRNNIGEGADGTITLAMGIVAALCLFALLNFGRTKVHSKPMVGLGAVAGIAGALAFLIGFIDAREVSSRKTEIFGTTIGPEIGWGLWMILIAGPALAITSAIVVKQVLTIAEANTEPTKARRYRISPPRTHARPVQPPAPAVKSPPPAAPEPFVDSTIPPTPTSTAPAPAPTPIVPPPPAPAPTMLTPSVEVPQAPAPVPPTTTLPPAPVPAPLPPPKQVVAAPPMPTTPAEPTPSTTNRGVGRPGLRSAAPWAGGVAALAAALAAGVWAGPYITGDNRSTEPTSNATITTKPMTTTPALSSTTTSPPPTQSATASGSSAAPATFGPFTTGDASVFVDGQPREVRGDVSCAVFGGKVNISIGPIGNPVFAAISETDLRVDSVSVGTVNGVALGYLDGSPSGNAAATKDGNAYRITGTAAGVDLRNPLQPYTRPFEIDVTCP